MARKAAVLAALVLTVAPASAPRADEVDPWDTFHVHLGPVDEATPSNRILISSACEQEVEYRYWVGRSGSPESRWDGPQYDARGPAASDGADFQATSGSFTVSKSKPVVLDVALRPDDVYEGPEHVSILFDGFTVAATFVGSATTACAQDQATTEQFEVAFTIEDDDPAPVSGPAPSPAGGSRPKGPGGSSTASPPSSQAKGVALVERASEALPEAAGVSLVGAEARLPRRGADAGRGRYAVVAALTLGLLGLAVARIRVRPW